LNSIANLYVRKAIPDNLAHWHTYPTTPAVELPNARIGDSGQRKTESHKSRKQQNLVLEFVHRNVLSLVSGNIAAINKEDVGGASWSAGKS
jgi:hypothetical protein